MSDNELKGGHAPATKVGGMRVVQHKPPKEDSPPKISDEDKEEFGEDSPTKAPAVIITNYYLYLFIIIELL